jgi:hypothetical protein
MENRIVNAVKSLRLLVANLQGMGHPSVSQLLVRNGYGYESEVVKALERFNLEDLKDEEDWEDGNDQEALY